MTVMDTDRERDAEYRIARARSRACTGKVSMSQRAAQDLAQRSRGPNFDAETGPLEAYRCPFGDEHANPELLWHVGHAMSMFALREMAFVLRARRGNAPTPVDPSTSVEIGQAVVRGRRRRR